MKKIITQVIFILLVINLSAQDWIKKLPQEKINRSNLTLFDIQKAFNDYWEPYNVVNGKYINSNGEKVKAMGWKQFKRWEWYWENRVNPLSGEFPATSAWEEFQKYKTKNQKSSNSNNGGNWFSSGPTASLGGYAGLGRINCVAFHPTDNNIIYAGAASGGLWKTTNSGGTWTVLGDNNPVLGISDICIKSTSPNTIYIASGDRESTIGSLGGQQLHDNNSAGVFISNDGGVTWSITGLSFLPSQQKSINRLLMDPANNSILYAATNSGVYKTIDDGNNWYQINAIEFSDMEFKPGNPTTIYGSSKNGDIYLSNNSGTSWSQILNTTDGRTELAVSDNNSVIVYAITSGNKVYKSTNSGSSFSIIFDGTNKNLLGYACDGSDFGTSQAFYDLTIAADPTNANIVFIGGVNNWKSTDGGVNWTINTHWSTACNGTAATVHADQHYLVFQNGTSALFVGNDGGLYKTSNYGTTWTYIGSGMVTSQLYRIGVSQTVPYEYIIGVQDNGTKAFLSGSWNDEIGGDGMECAIDYTNKNTLYGEYVNGDIKRSLDHGITWNDIRAGITGTGSWVTPYIIDPNVHTTLYIGYQDVFKSINQGTSWTKISNWNNESLKSLTIAPSNSNYIYTATKNILYKTTDGGVNWSDITGTLPVTSNFITYITVKADDPNTIWVSMGNYNANKVFQTSDGGTTWIDISAGLPSVPVMCVIQNKQSTTRVDLYAATDIGVFFKAGTDNWQTFSSGLPNVLTTELEIYYAPNADSNKLYAGTYGRGLWTSELNITGLPSVANFSVNNTVPLTSSTVSFTDLSSYTPTAWLWSFYPATVSFVGGTSSTSQHPQVMFNNPGVYSVTLVVSNMNGNDTVIMTNYIHAGQSGIWTGITSSNWNTASNWENYLIPVSTDNITINPSANPPIWTGNLNLGSDCGNLSITNGARFSVTGDININSGSILTTNGNSRLIVGGSWTNNGTFNKDTATLEFNGTAESKISKSVFMLGGGKTIFGNTLASLNNHYFQFDCTSPFVIKSACVKASAAANRTFYWANAAGVVQQTITINVPAGTSRVTLNFNIPVGTNHRLGVSNLKSSMYGDNSGISYPYSIGNVATIKNVDGSLVNSYYYYYDIEYSTLGAETVNNIIVSKSGNKLNITNGLNVTADMILKSGAWLTNNTGSTLNIAANMTLESDSTGSASFIDNGVTNINGVFKVERYIPDWLNVSSNQGWHQISTPIPGNSVSDFTPYPSGSYEFYKWDEVTLNWLDQKIAANNITTFISGAGYIVSYQNAGKHIFSGNYIKSDVSPAITYTVQSPVNTTLQGWNLIGNPYTSAIDITNISAWTKSNVNDFVTVYDDKQAFYRVWNGTVGNLTDNVIPAMQAFWVKANSANPSITIPASSRVHSGQNLYKSNVVSDVVKLKLSSPNGFVDELFVYFTSSATNELNDAVDVPKLSSNIQEAPLLYSYIGTEKYAINAMGELIAPVSVPLGFEPKISGNFTIKAFDLKSFESGSEVFLQDLQTGVFQDILQNNSYDFFADKSDNTMRFVLYFNKKINNNETKASVINIFSYNKDIYVNSSEKIKQISIYNSIGQLIYEEENCSGIFKYRMTEAKTAYYIVRVITDKNVNSKKVFIK